MKVHSGRPQLQPRVRYEREDRDTRATTAAAGLRTRLSLLAVGVLQPAVGVMDLCAVKAVDNRLISPHMYRAHHTVRRSLQSNRLLDTQQHRLTFGYSVGSKDRPPCGAPADNQYPVVCVFV